MSLANVIKLYDLFQREGLFGALQRIYPRLKKMLLRLCFAPLAFPIAMMIKMISPLVKIRFIRLYSDRIGHYAWNTEYWLCILDSLADINQKKIKTFYYTIAGQPICNKQLHRMWKRAIPILFFPYLWNEVNRYLTQYGGKTYANDLLKIYYDKQDLDRWNLLGNIKQCHIHFTEREHRKGQRLMEEMGMPKGTRFICLLGRDSRYLNVIKPGIDFSYHNHRNVDINHYQKAAKILADKGYYVIRMGKFVQDLFDVNHSHIIDYANSPFRSDFLDIYLSAHCFFFMSVGTGIESTAQIFRRPVLITNFTLHDFGILPDWKILITKKLFDTKNNKILSFKEMFELYTICANRDVLKILNMTHENSLKYIENTEDEIVDAVCEMEKRLIGDWQYSEEDELLQRKFWKIFPSEEIDSMPQLKLPLFKYGNLENHLRIGAAFLKKNMVLLD